MALCLGSVRLTLLANQQIFIVGIFGVYSAPLVKKPTKQVNIKFLVNRPILENYSDKIS